ncbi:MAG: DHH family phosphoesterase [Traorella sp.]
MNYIINRNNHYNLLDIIKSHYGLNDSELAKLYENELSDPRSLTNMNKCLNILRDVLKKKEKILIVGDYDCDGICATAILCKAFSKCGLDYGFYIPNRLKEGYGLNVSILKKAYDKGYRNVITVDNGVKAYEAMEFAKKMGIRLIISDHHLYDEKDIVCDCFMHPFLNDDEYVNCSGAGIALQIARCMIPHDKDIVCYAAIACIADCMDVTKENRRIIKKGIEYLNHGYANPLHALKNSPQDLFNIKMMSYTIIPKINSMGRLCDVVNVNNAVRYLLLNDMNAIYHSANQINHVNELRKEKTLEMEKIALQLLNHQPFEIVSSTQFHEGIVGLLASRLANQYKKPFIVLTETNEEYRGSIRGIEGLNLIDYFKDFHDFYKFGGHSLAAGVTLKKDQFNNLKEYVKNHPIMIQKQDPIICEQINEECLSIQNVQQYLSLAPFGNGFEEILFYIENIQIKNKISLSNGKYYKVISNNKLEYLFFNSSLHSKIKNGMNVIGKLSINDYKGNKKINILVEDILEDNHE